MLDEEDFLEEEEEEDFLEDLDLEASQLALAMAFSAFCSAIQTFSWLERLDVCHDFLERKDNPGMISELWPSSYSNLLGQGGDE